MYMKVYKSKSPAQYIFKKVNIVAICTWTRNRILSESQKPLSIANSSLRRL